MERSGATLTNAQARRAAWILVAALVAALIGCGGDGEEAPPPFVSFVSLEPTIFFKSDASSGGRLRQMARLTVHNDGDAQVDSGQYDVTVQLAGQSYSLAPGLALPAQSDSTVDVFIDPLPRGAEESLTLALAVRGHPQFQISQPWRHQRQWKLFLAPYSHLDVGFSDSQDGVLAKQLDNLDTAMDLIEETDGDASYDPDSRFKYVVEQSWPAVEYLRRRPAADVQRLLQHLRTGRMELTGFHNGHLNKFMGDESLWRSLYSSAERIQREHGIPVVSALVHDSGDASSIVQPLARAGIRYVQFGANTMHYALPALFYLQAPSDPQSRVLMWLAPNVGEYGENTTLGLRPPGPSSPLEPHNPNAPLPADWEQRVTDHLTWLESQDLPLPLILDRFEMKEARFSHPYDAYFVSYYPAHDGDNGVQDITPSLVARTWNAKYAYPRMKLSTVREFFEYVEGEFGDEIPTLTGDFPGFWGEQIFFAALQTDPEKEARNRAFTNLVATGEKLAVVAAEMEIPVAYSTEAVGEAFRRIVLNNDHNPGPVPLSGHAFTQEAVNEWKQTRRQWTEEAAALAEGLAAEAVTALASRIAAEGTTIVVFNSSSWERSDVVEAQIGRAEPFTLIDLETGEEVVHQVVATSEERTRIVFVAREVPSVGYRSFRVVAGLGDSPSAPAFDIRQREDAVVAESRFYRATMDARDGGGISSLWDHVLGRELVRSNARYRLNQFVQLIRAQTVGELPAVWNVTEAPGFSSVQLSVVENGPVRAVVRVVGTHDSSIRLQGDVRLLINLLGPFAVRPPATLPPVPDVSPVELTQDVILYQDLRRIDFVQRFSDTPIQLIENTFAFPVDVPGAALQIELPYNRVHVGPHDPFDLYGIPRSEQGDFFLTASFMTDPDLFAITHQWMDGQPPDNVLRHWLDVSNDDFGVTFSSIESGAIVPGEFTELEPGRFGQAPFAPLSTAGWYHLTVGPTWLGQLLFGVQAGGDYTFRSALTTHLGRPDAAGDFGGEATAARFGWGFTTPMQVRVLESSQAGSLPATASFVRIEQPNVILTAMKRAEDGNGIVLRLYETNGQATSARVALPFLACFTARLADGVERPLAPLQVEEGSLTVEMTPGMVATVRVDGC